MTRYSIIIPPGVGFNKFVRCIQCRRGIIELFQGGVISQELWLVGGRWLSAAYAGAARCMQETVGVKQGRMEIIMILMES